MVKKPQIKKLMFSKTAMMLLFVLLTSATAWAEKGDVVATGTCGDNLTWTLTENGEATVTFLNGTSGHPAYTLTITGTGEMPNYSNSTATPWWKYQQAITRLELPQGLANIGSFAFYLFIQKLSIFVV